MTAPRPAAPTRPGQTATPDGWLLNQLASHDLFFASPNRQMRSQASAQDLTASTPASAATVADLMARARNQGIQAPVLFGAIPFVATRPARLTIPFRLVETDCPAVRTVPDRLTRPAVIGRTPVPAPAVYGTMVEQALDIFAKGEVRKIVLARTMDVELDGLIDPATVMRDLLARNGRGYTFNLPIPETGADGASMMGASPELLVRRESGKVFLNPLAGSIPRHPDPDIDRQRRESLAVSEKDLREHAYVISDMARKLADHCIDLQVPEKPSVIGTDTLWHLSTFITAHLRDPSMTALDIGLALHPTPAMCGFPTAAASDCIQQLEPFEREFFAGLIGWQRANGDGEWALTIRCARFDGQRWFRLYAGAGIVAGSDPASEIRETETKMGTFLKALGGE